MSNVICARCARVHPWTAGAGGRLADKSCFVCGGRLEMWKRTHCKQCGRGTVLGPQRVYGAIEAARFGRGRWAFDLKYYPGQWAPTIPGVALEEALPAPSPTFSPARPRVEAPRSAPRPHEAGERIAAALIASGQPITIEAVCDVAEAVNREERASQQCWDRMRWCCDLLKAMFGGKLADTFGPNDLRAVRRRLIEYSYGDGRALSRKEVNRRLRDVRRIFRYAESYELVRVGISECLRSVEPVKIGRTRAVELPPIRPVSEQVFSATLPWCSPTIAGMLLLQDATGMRSGEICSMRVRNIDRSGATWIYTPESHKTQRFGKTRTIPLGPQAREILLSEMVNIDRLLPGDYLFSPARETERRFREMRGLRKSPLQPSHEARRKTIGATRSPGERYLVNSYAHAVRRAAERAGVESWRPYQLRHNCLTRVREEHGLEAAAAIGGHSSITTTLIYAETSLKKAAEIAEQLG